MDTRYQSFVCRLTFPRSHIVDVVFGTMVLTFTRSRHINRSIGILRRCYYIARSSSTQSSTVITSSPPSPPRSDEWEDLLKSIDPDSIQPHPTEAPSKPEPWKTLLEYPARAAWRVASSVPPPPFQHAFDQIFDGAKSRHTRKVLRKTHETVLEQHHQLALRRDRERQRILRGQSADTHQVEKDQGILPVAYGPNETLANMYFRSFPHFTIVQRVLREVQSLLKHQPTPLNIQRVYDFGVGCGSSSAAALHAFPSTVQWIHGIDPSFTMRDVAKCFLQEFAQYAPPPAESAPPVPPRRPPQMTFSAHAESNATTLGTFDLSLLTFTATELSQTDAILAAAGICWEKLQPNGLFVMIEPGTPDGFSSIRTVRNMLIDCCEPDSYQIIAPCTHNGRCPMDRFQYREKHKSAAIVPSTPNDQDAPGDAEDDLLSDASDGEESVEKFLANENDDDNDDEDEEGDIEVDFPSLEEGEEEEEETEGGLKHPDDGGAGMRKGYCSFVQSMPGGGGRGEKFSYLVVQKRASTGASSTPVSSSSSWVDVNLTHLLQEATDHGSPKHAQRSILNEAVEIEKRFLNSDEDDLGLELVRSEAIRQSYGRIVRAPKKYRGQVWVDLCVAPGSIVRHHILKRQASLAPGIYSAARKSRWGGLWPNASNLQAK
jgi:ribosomal protein RSM22 (predicted rRNA methylase)